MPTIIKKGTNPSAFRLSKRTVVCRPNIMTFISDEEFRELKAKWWGFIEPRIWSEKNPFGSFVISEKSLNYTEGLNKEIGEVEDNSMKIDLTKSKKKRKK